MLQATLIELPITQLVDRINTEMYDNPALETSGERADTDDYDGYQNSDADTNSPDADADFETYKEQEDRQSALDQALSNIGRDDEELPVYHGGRNCAEEKEDFVYGNTISFYEQLKEQVGFINIDDTQKDIMEYIIGSLDDDGLLRKSAESISDELAIYHGIDTTTQEIDELVGILQDFDPAGIGARNLQECLMLQIKRRSDSVLKHLMEKTIGDYFDEFTRKHWAKISSALKLTEQQTDVLKTELCKLNPKPGASMSESIGHSQQQITPDFIVEIQDDGKITFHLNNDDVPELFVSQSYADSLKEYQTNQATMSKKRKEEFLYTKRKVEAAQGFIEAIKMRRRTLCTTMQAIIDWQYRFFLEGDESLLRPMILKDIAEKTALSKSTISRVSKSKYAQTRWGIFPLRHFFSDAYITENGEELSTRQIKTTLCDLIEAEDKEMPLSDDALKLELNKRGFPIARRTVAKYREQLNIPIARLRKK